MGTVKRANYDLKEFKERPVVIQYFHASLTQVSIYTTSESSRHLQHRSLNRLLFIHVFLLSEAHSFTMHFTQCLLFQTHNFTIITVCVCAQ